MFSEKAPYIVTLIIAGLAWTITHIVDRLLATPMLTYQIQELAENGKRSVYITLNNIERDRAFRDVRLTLTAAPGDSLSNPVIIPVEPASEGDQPGMQAGRTFDFKFPEIQPGGRFEISASYKGPTRPSLRISLANGSIYAVQPSTETFLVEHEIEVLTGLVVVWLITLVGVSIFHNRTAGVVDDDT
jgi:hypothetical protein